MATNKLTLKKIDVYEFVNRANKKIRFTKQGNSWNGLVCLIDDEGRKLIAIADKSLSTSINSFLTDECEIQVMAACPELLIDLNVEIKGE